MVLAPAHPVEELVHHHDVLRVEFFPQAAHRRNTEQPSHPQGTQGPDIGRVRQLVGRQTVPAAVPGQEEDGAPGQLAADQAIGRRAERGVDLDFAQVLQSFHLIESAPSDHADGWCLAHRGNP